MVHAVCIEIDEGQDLDARAYTEMIESMRAGLKGAQMRIHGVSNADNGTFDKILESDPSTSAIKWKKHRYIGPDRPDWTDEERTRKIEFYGGVGATEDNSDYERNVLGLASNSSALLLSQRRLMACVRIGESTHAIKYNNDIYRKIRITDESLRGPNVLQQLFQQLEQTVASADYAGFRLGADIGFVRDPTECLVFGEIDRGVGTPPLLRLLLRFTLIQISQSDQLMFFTQLFEWLGSRMLSFGIDRNGVGLPLYQDLLDEHRENALDESLRSRLFGYAASEKVPVGLDDRDPRPWETEEDLIIKQYVSHWATGELRRQVDSGSLELPYDTELIAEFLGTRKDEGRKVGEARTRNKTEGSAISLHCTDAMFQVLQARSLPDIHLRIFPPKKPVMERFDLLQ